MSTISTSFYLVVKAAVDERGYCRSRPTFRAAKNKPRTAADEIAVAVSLNIPASLFRRPQLQAVITVPDDQAPAKISADVQDNIAQAIRDQLGLAVTIQVAGS